MASFQGILAGLRKAEGQLEQQLVNVRGAIAHLAGTSATRGRQARKRGPGRPKGSGNKGIIIVGGRKKRKMSAKARKAISDAQKKRWAKQRAAAKK